MTFRPAAIPLLLNWFSTVCTAPAQLKGWRHSTQPGQALQARVHHRDRPPGAQVQGPGLQGQLRISSHESGVLASASAVLVHRYAAFGHATHLILAVHPTPAASPLLLPSAPACIAFHAARDNLTVDPAALFVVHRRASSWRRCRATRSSRTRSGWRMSCPTGEDAAEPRPPQPAQLLVTHCTGVRHGPLHTGHAACMRCSASQRTCTASFLTPIFLCTCSENNITVNTLAFLRFLWLSLSYRPSCLPPVQPCVLSHPTCLPDTGSTVQSCLM